jgi:hypothetical protein
MRLPIRLRPSTLPRYQGVKPRYVDNEGNYLVWIRGKWWVHDATRDVWTRVEAGPPSGYAIRGAVWRGPPPPPRRTPQIDAAALDRGFVWHPEAEEWI